MYNYYLIYYGLTFLALIITIGAQIYVSSSYSKYSKIKNSNNITGEEAAHLILNKHGLQNVNVVETNGYLTDHYDPTKKVIRLSKSNFNDSSIGAVAVAAHECGHAIQDKENYAFLRLRSSLIPFVNFASYTGYFAILLGCLFGSLNLIWLGIIFEIVILIFQIITLPVEINASQRALANIKELNILDQNEQKEGKTVLTAAALTYVASVATTIIEILRLILIYGRRDDRR